jgi:hypothetical protein
VTGCLATACARVTDVTERLRALDAAVANDLHHPAGMRWDRDYDSPNVEDRRAEGGAGLGGGGGIPLWGIMAIAGRFGWKGVVIALIVVGLLSYSGSNLCSGSGAYNRAVDPRSVATERADSDLTHFVGFVLDDVNRTWTDQLPGYQDARLVLFRNAIRSACGTATTTRSTSTWRSTTSCAAGSAHRATSHRRT